MSTATDQAAHLLPTADSRNLRRTATVTTWLRPYDQVTLMALAVAATIWASTGIPVLPLRPWFVSHAFMLTEFLVLALVVLFVVRMFIRMRRRTRADARLAKAMLSRHFGKATGITTLRYLVSIQIILTVYTTIKQAIPLINPARYDAQLIAIEKFVHFGLNPAWFLAASNPPQWWLTILDKAYYLWFPIKPIVVAYWMTHRNRRKGHHFLAAYVMVWILGVLLGLAYPSHGPCYVDASRFPAAEMPLSEFTEGWLGYNYGKLETITAWGDGNLFFGCGLMALPSLHVTVCVLYVIFFWKERAIWKWASLTYLGLIFLGSLYSGWHYAIDGYVGAILAATCTFLAARLCYRGIRPRRPGALVPAAP